MLIESRGEGAGKSLDLNCEGGLQFYRFGF
jgi:hypothetical protein